MQLTKLTRNDIKNLAINYIGLLLFAFVSILSYEIYGGIIE